MITFLWIWRRTSNWSIPAITPRALRLCYTVRRRDGQCLDRRPSGNDPHGCIVGVPSLWPRPGGVLQQHGSGVLRPIDSEQANFRVARHPTTIRRSCCRELDARVEPLVFHQLIYTAVCANVSVL